MLTFLLLLRMCWIAEAETTQLPGGKDAASKERSKVQHRCYEFVRRTDSRSTGS